MTGVYGRSADDVDDLLESMYATEAYERSDLSTGIVDFGMHHPTAGDSRENGPGLVAVSGDDVSGLIYGHVFDPNGDPAELLSRIHSNPDEQLSRVDGNFLIATVDDEGLLVATDKLGTRQCYYSTEGEFVFSSELRAVVDQFSEKRINHQAIFEMLRYHFVVGEKSLDERVKTLPPGSYLSFDGAGVDVSNYFDLDIGGRNPDTEAIYATLKDTLETSVSSVPSNRSLGAWLSGGLDSRVAIGILSDATELSTFTYDANPGNGSNPPLAKRIADTLEVSHEVTQFDSGSFCDVLEQGVALTDGMRPWIHYHNLPFILESLSVKVDAMLEFSGQGEFFGEDIEPERLNRITNPAETLAENFAISSKSAIDSLLVSDEKWENPFETGVEASAQGTDRGVVLDVLYRTFYPNAHYRTKFEQSQTSHRVPYVNGDFLNTAVNIPDSARERGNTWLCGKGTTATAPLKLHLVRRHDRGLEYIPYERTALAPKWPLPLHTAAGYVKRCRSSGSNMYSQWYRNVPSFQNRIDELLDTAMERTFFDADTLHRMQREEKTGEDNHIGTLSVITTIELWLQMIE